MSCLETFILDYWEKKTQTENQQLFEGIIDMTLFDIVEGLDSCLPFSSLCNTILAWLMNCTFFVLQSDPWLD